eukprot:3547568-Prymnesium_polylepis.1
MIACFVCGLDCEKGRNAVRRVRPRAPVSSDDKKQLKDTPRRHERQRRGRRAGSASGGRAARLQGNSPVKAAARGGEAPPEPAPRAPAAGARGTLGSRHTE